jgi:serine/threonine-protein kinase
MAAAAPRRPRRRWIGAVAGGMLAALVLVFGGSLALNLLPADLLGALPQAGTPAAANLPAGLPGAAETVAPAVVDVAATTPLAPAVNDAPLGGATAQSPAEGGGPVSGESTPTAPGGVPTSSTPGAVTAPPLPTPAGDVRSFWAEAEAAYQDGDWRNALEFATLARRIDPRYGGANGDDLLFESQVGLAADAIVTGNREVALEHLNAALALRPEEGRVKTVQAALEALMAPGTLNISMARWTLATALGSYAQQLLDGENPCAAAEQLQAAVTLQPVERSAQLLAETQAACLKARRSAEVRRQLALLTGRLLYSTQEGNAYGIYRASAEPQGRSSRLIADGTQPSRQWRSNVVAFHSTQASAPGIALFDVAAGLAPDRRTLQLTTGAGDALDAPPSWSGDDSTLVYGSALPDGRTRIYRAEIAAPAEALDLGPGRDPAWSPKQDRIVFNGVNDQGGEPGLWLMDSDGGNRQRLTDNGNDIRPVWTPDGLSVVFMSSRDGNWEVYRLNLLTGDDTRLTTNGAQDGLPAVSPDGQWVAFASDRGGYWRIWVTPLEGGEAQPLIEIEGVLTNWLEHAIQWIP